MKYSIVIPVGPGRKIPILTYIKRQKFDKKKYEVIVIKGTNVPENRNNGFKKSKGKYIIYLDDDAFIEEDFLTKVDYFINKHPKIDIIGGAQLTPSDDGPFAKATGKALASPLINPGACNRYRKTPENLNANEGYTSGALMIIKREVLKRINFDIDLYPADDVLFVKKAIKEGFKVASSPDIYIYHQRRADAKGLFKQYFDYGKAGAELSDKVSGGRGLGFYLPALLVLYFMLYPLIGTILYLLSWEGLFLLSAVPILLYCLLIVYYKTPVIIIHFAYGLGILEVWGEKLTFNVMSFILIIFVLVISPFLKNAFEAEYSDCDYSGWEPPPSKKPSIKERLLQFGLLCLWIIALPLLLVILLLGIILVTPIVWLYQILKAN